METLARRPLPKGGPDYEGQFRLDPGETVADVLAFYTKVGAETEAIVAEYEIDASVPVPDAPWFPRPLAAGTHESGCGVGARPA